MIKIAVIGDSLSQNSLRNYNWVTQSAQIIRELTGEDVRMLNAAIAGSTWDLAINSKQHFAGTKSQVEVVIDFAPDYVICALGINDAVYVGGSTVTAIVANAVAVKTAINAALPSCKIIYAEECPHDIATVGATPSSMTNVSCVPASHQTITLKGLSNVRVNNSTYLGTSVSASTLAAHQVWGGMTSQLRSLFDGYFSVNIWKMARLGMMSDTLHVDNIGQGYWTWVFVSYLATSPFLEFRGLAINGLATSNTNLDAFFIEAAARTISGNMPACYRGYDFYRKLAGWPMKAPGARMLCDSVLTSGAKPLTIMVEDAQPNSAIYYATDNINFVSASRMVSPTGTHLQTFCPGDAFADFRSAGSHTLYLAAVSPDGSSTDVFQATVNVITSYP